MLCVRKRNPTAFRSTARPQFCPSNPHGIYGRFGIIKINNSSYHTPAPTAAPSTMFVQLLHIVGEGLTGRLTGRLGHPACAVSVPTVFPSTMPLERSAHGKGV